MNARVLLLCLAACQYHVRLDPPRPTLTPEERVDLFWKRRPIGEAYAKVDGALVNRSMMLADRTEIVSPEDLEPLVNADSQTMHLARASVAARIKQRTAWWVGIGALVVGAAMSGFGTFDGPRFGLPTPWIGYSLMIAGGVVGYPISSYYLAKELRLRKRAFVAYPRDLGDRLNVCAQGTQVVPCEAPIENTPATTVPGRTASLGMR